MTLKSKSNYFYQSKEALDQGHKEMLQFLDIKDFTADQIGWFEDAYNYFREHPNGYDGATASQDLEDVKGLELGAMLHDYLYLFLNCYASRKYMKKADQVLKSVMKLTHKSGWEISRRMFLLFLLRGLYPLFKRWIKGERMNKNQKKQIKSIYTTFLN
jgi:hypothetical protein